MLTYWMMYFVAATGALMYAGKNKIRSNGVAWMLVGSLYIFLIGFRKSGGDWNNYLHRFVELQYMTFDTALVGRDRGYQTIAYYCSDWGLGFFTLTMICAVLSMVGLIKFLRQQPNAWLGMTVAVPYLILVVYMGYMRQGVALGLVMWAIVALQRGKFLKFLVLIVIATTFHKSAIMMIAFGIFSGDKGKLFKLLGVIAAVAGVWSLFVSSEATVLWKNYVDAQMQSQGAMIRVLLNAIPAVLLLYFRKEWKKYFDDYRFWVMVSFASLASIVMVKFASTAVDRMALYFIPLQIIVYARLPLLAQKRLSPKTTTYLIVLFYFVILFVWLNFAANVRYWLPYRNMIWQELF